MANVQELQTAIGEMLVARRNAAYRKKDAGDPRNPFQAKIGLEREFYEASQSVRTYDLILKLLENETKREALKRMSRYRREPLRVESNACKKPAPAGVCAAQRQIFGQQSGQKIEVL